MSRVLRRGMFAVVLAVGMSTVVGWWQASAVTLDEEVFAACREVRLGPTEPTPTRAQVRSLGRKFASLSDRKARRRLAPALNGAASTKERRRAVEAAYDWCEEEADAYQTVTVTLGVPSVVEVVDATSATITGTVSVGASVTARVSLAGTARSLPAAVDASGAFTLVVPDLPLGESTVTINATADLEYPATPQTVRIRRVESEAAYKGSAREIPSDELRKDPAGLRGTRIYSRGEVFQYDSRTGLTAMLVSVRVVNPGRFEFWTDPVLLRLETAAQGSGIDEDDIIEFWGEVEGPYSYSTAIGGSNTVPAIRAKYVDLLEKR